MAKNIRGSNFKFVQATLSQTFATKPNKRRSLGHCTLANTLIAQPGGGCREKKNAPFHVQIIVWGNFLYIPRGLIRRRVRAYGSLLVKYVFEGISMQKGLFLNLLVCLRI